MYKREQKAHLCVQTEKKGWRDVGEKSERGLQLGLLSPVDRVSRCWNGPLSQNVGSTQQIGRSSDLSTAYSHRTTLHRLPPTTTNTSGPEETFPLLTHNAYTSGAKKEAAKCIHVSLHPTEYVFFLKMNPSPLCPHFDTQNPLPLWSFQRNLFLWNATCLTENAWKAFTRPTLFLGPVKMHIESLLKGGKTTVALWVRIQATGW